MLWFHFARHLRRSSALLFNYLKKLRCRSPSFDCDVFILPLVIRQWYGQKWLYVCMYVYISLFIDTSKPSTDEILCYTYKYINWKCVRLLYVHIYTHHIRDDEKRKQWTTCQQLFSIWNAMKASAKRERRKKKRGRNVGELWKPEKNIWRWHNKTVTQQKRS